ncbi:hypothetical protein [Undibacterium sp. Ren11W]|uniref:hypothetical protein n=1 Tax=Undibacterium sp. Ren11W TaxID=3413045 RepID=UPI003BF2E5CF
MIITIATQDYVGTAHFIATTLARRRANAGRDVLLLSQKILPEHASQNQEKENQAWFATEMKAGASSFKLNADQLEQELADIQSVHRDIVVDLPQATQASSLCALAASSFAVFMLKTADWHANSESLLIQQMKAARSANAKVPVLLIVDEATSPAGRAIIATLTASVTDLRIQALATDQQATLAYLYRTIFQTWRAQ